MVKVMVEPGATATVELFTADGAPSFCTFCTNDATGLVRAVRAGEYALEVGDGCSAELSHAITIEGDPTVVV